MGYGMTVLQNVLLPSRRRVCLTSTVPSKSKLLDVVDSGYLVSNTAAQGEILHPWNRGPSVLNVYRDYKRPDYRQQWQCAALVIYSSDDIVLVFVVNTLVSRKHKHGC